MGLNGPLSDPGGWQGSQGLGEKALRCTSASLVVCITELRDSILKRKPKPSAKRSADRCRILMERDLARSPLLPAGGYGSQRLAFVIGIADGITADEGIRGLATLPVSMTFRTTGQAAAVGTAVQGPG